MNRLIIAASFAIALLGGIDAAVASTVTIDFTGKVTSLDDAFGVSGYSVNGAISGQMVLDSLPDTPSYSESFPHQYYVIYNGSAKVNVGGTLLSGPEGHIEEFAAGINTGGSGYDGLRFSLTAGNQSLFSLIFDAYANSAPPLLSLTDLPTDYLSVFAYLGGPPHGSNSYMYGEESGHSFYVAFVPDSVSISVAPIPPVAQTPIPAALPLFASALGGLGFMGMRRRKAD